MNPAPISLGYFAIKFVKSLSDILPTVTFDLTEGVFGKLCTKLIIP